MSAKVTDSRASRRAPWAGGFAVGATVTAVLASGCVAEPASTVSPEDGGGPASAREGTESPRTAERSSAAVEAGWTRVAEDEGIVVSSHPSDRSKLPIFRGVAQVDAPLLEVLAVVTDADRHQEWLFSCSDSALVEQTSAAAGIVYNRTKAPWPVPDRDVVLDSRVEIVDGEREIADAAARSVHAA